MDNICKICNEIVLKDSHYYKNHKIKISDYHLKYFPKYDLYTKEQLLFKNKENYFNSDFNNKINLKKYLESISKENGLEYLKNWLLKRKENKNLIYAPSHFELKTLQYPSIKFFHKYYGLNSYEQICEDLNLIVRYDYNQKITLENKQLNFVVDTRENSILDVPNKQIQKLDVGDYTIENSNIIIEKKSLVDFCGTLSKGFYRFIKELERTKNNNKYLIILVEEKFNNIQSIKYLPHTKKIKATSDFIFHRARQILNLYPLNCQIACCDGKKDSINLIKHIFSIKNDSRTIDYQYLLDTNQI